MVTHIVFWNLKDSTQKAVQGSEMKQRLESLVGVVPGLISAKVGLGFHGFDVCLVCTLESREALEIYQNNPAHLSVKEYVHSVIAQRVCCDFES